MDGIGVVGSSKRHASIEIVPTNSVLVRLVDHTGLFIGIFRPSGLTNTLPQLPMDDMLHCERLLVFSIWPLNKLGAWVDLMYGATKPSAATLCVCGYRESPKGSCRSWLHQDWQMGVITPPFCAGRCVQPCGQGWQGGPKASAEGEASPCTPGKGATPAIQALIDRCTCMLPNRGLSSLWIFTNGSDQAMRYQAR